MSPKPRKPIAGERGQSLVEFALVLPILLVVMLMITEFARATWIQNTLNLAAYHGARAAMVWQDPDVDWHSVAEDSANRWLRVIGLKTESQGGDVKFTAYGRRVDGTTILTDSLAYDFHFLFSGPLPTTASGKTGLIPITPIPLRGVVSMDAQKVFAGDIP